MKFDVIIGNPPYQSDDNGFGVSATPLYNLFIMQAKKLKPKYITMIIPTKYFTGGKGLKQFRQDMLNDIRISNITLYPRTADCFKGVKIFGGVQYFLWELAKTDEKMKIVTKVKGQPDKVQVRNLKYNGFNIIIQDTDQTNILRKIKHQATIIGYEKQIKVKPFKLITSYKSYKPKDKQNYIKLYGQKHVGYINEQDIPKNKQWVKPYKVFISATCDDHNKVVRRVLLPPFIGTPNTICTDTYNVFAVCNNYETARNICMYISTKFFRYMVGIVKLTQHANGHIYRFVPQMSIHQVWTDQDLYKHFGLSEQEIQAIETSIKPMAPVFVNPWETHLNKE